MPLGPLENQIDSIITQDPNEVAVTRVDTVNPVAAGNEEVEFTAATRSRAENGEYHLDVVEVQPMFRGFNEPDATMANENAEITVQNPGGRPNSLFNSGYNRVTSAIINQIAGPISDALNVPQFVIEQLLSQKADDFRGNLPSPNTTTDSMTLTENYLGDDDVPLSDPDSIDIPIVDGRPTATVLIPEELEEVETPSGVTNINFSGANGGGTATINNLIPIESWPQIRISAVVETAREGVGVIRFEPEIVQSIPPSTVVEVETFSIQDEFGCSDLNPDYDEFVNRVDNFQTRKGESISRFKEEIAIASDNLETTRENINEEINKIEDGGGQRGALSGGGQPALGEGENIDIDTDKFDEWENNIDNAQETLNELENTITDAESLINDMEGGIAGLALSPNCRGPLEDIKETRNELENLSSELSGLEGLRNKLDSLRDFEPQIKCTDSRLFRSLMFGGKAGDSQRPEDNENLQKYKIDIQSAVSEVESASNLQELRDLAGVPSDTSFSDIRRGVVEPHNENIETARERISTVEEEVNITCANVARERLQDILNIRDQQLEPALEKFRGVERLGCADLKSAKEAITTPSAFTEFTNEMAQFPDNPGPADVDAVSNLQEKADGNLKKIQDWKENNTPNQTLNCEIEFNNNPVLSGTMTIEEAWSTVKEELGGLSTDACSSEAYNELDSRITELDERVQNAGSNLSISTIEEIKSDATGIGADIERAKANDEINPVCADNLESELNPVKSRIDSLEEGDVQFSCADIDGYNSVKESISDLNARAEEIANAPLSSLDPQNVDDLKRRKDTLQQDINGLQRPQGMDDFDSCITQLENSLSRADDLLGQLDIDTQFLTGSFEMIGSGPDDRIARVIVEDAIATSPEDVGVTGGTIRTIPNSEGETPPLSETDTVTRVEIRATISSGVGDGLPNFGSTARNLKFDVSTPAGASGEFSMGVPPGGEDNIVIEIPEETGRVDVTMREIDGGETTGQFATVRAPVTIPSLGCPETKNRHSDIITSIEDVDARVQELEVAKPTKRDSQEIQSIEQTISNKLNQLREEKDDRETCTRWENMAENALSTVRSLEVREGCQDILEADPSIGDDIDSWSSRVDSEMAKPPENRSKGKLSQLGTEGQELARRLNQAKSQDNVCSKFRSTLSSKIEVLNNAEVRTTCKDIINADPQLEADVKSWDERVGSVLSQSAVQMESQEVEQLIQEGQSLKQRLNQAKQLNNTCSRFEPVIQGNLGDLQGTETVDIEFVACPQRSDLHAEADSLISELETKTQNAPPNMPSSRFQELRSLESEAASIVTELNDQECMQEFTDRIERAGRELESKASGVRTGDSGQSEASQEREELIELLQKRTEGAAEAGSAASIGGDETTEGADDLDEVLNE